MPFCTRCGTQASARYCPNCGNDLLGPSASAPQSQPTPPAGPSGTIPPPKKSKVLPLLLIGCLGILVLGGVGTFLTGWFVTSKVKEIAGGPGAATAVAKILTAANPDIEVIDVDSDSGVIEIREKSTGKRMTIDFEQARLGRIAIRDESGGRVELEGEGGRLRVETPEGTATFGGGDLRLPSWIPRYSGHIGQVLLSSTEQGGERGTVTFKSNDDPGTVTAFYETEFTGQGLAVDRNRTEAAGSAVILLTVKGNGRTARVNALRAMGDTVVTIQWE